MTSLVRKSEMYFALDYVELVFEKLQKFARQITPSMLMSSWRNICHSGTMVKNWKPLYKNILGEIQNESFSH